jgi:PAS domain S-box-containing protein
MSEARRLFLLILIMVIVSATVAGVAINRLYEASFEQQRMRLIESAHSQAKLIETIARFNIQHQKRIHPDNNIYEAFTLAEIIEAHSKYEGFGMTGEFTLARREKDMIIFLLSHRHYDLDQTKPVPFNSKLAEPMRQALSGKSGTLVGLDYRGKMVLAAYEPVGALDLGIVAKIDLKEIRAPFIKASFIAGGLAFVAVCIGAVIFLLITTPIIRKMKESEAKHRAFFQEALDAIFIADAKTRMIVDANKAAQNLLGRSLNEIKQMKQSDVVSAKDAKIGKRRFDKVIEKGHLGPQEYIIISKDGRRTPVESQSNVIALKGHKLVTAFFRDITDRKQAEKELQRSRIEWGETFDVMSDWVSLIDTDTHTIIRSNRAGEKLLGVPVSEIIGKTCCNFVHGSETPAPDCPLQKMLKTGNRESKEFEMPERNLWVYVTADPVRNENGDIINAVYVVRDISQQKQLEMNLLQAQKMEAIGTLAGGIAHDFNNILSAIIGHSELFLYNAPKDSSMVESIQEVLKAGHRAKDLVEQILTFSRHEEAERKPVRITPIVNDALKLLRASLPATIEIQQREKVGLDIVSSDPTRIHQVIMNLCTNAGYAMKQNGGVLKVNLENVDLKLSLTDLYLNITPGIYLKISISDTGPGISPEVLDRIFEPYFTTKEKGEGTGLGLAVAYGIVESYGGTITVQSVEGKGTTFDIYLPIEEEQETSKEELKESIPTGTERILFIDDEDAIVGIVKRMLNRLGYDVIAKTSSKEALELFHAEPSRFDLVITDMTMPGMTGDKVAQEVMKVDSKVPIILCTGYSDQISEEKAKKMGIKEFIMKPFVMKNLAKIVRDVLDGKG